MYLRTLLIVLVLAAEIDARLDRETDDLSAPKLR